jgi:hypothetical protein
MMFSLLKTCLEFPVVINLETKLLGQVLVAHACNPSYSGGRDQEDQGLKPAQANSSQDPISKIPITKRAGGVAQGEGPEFKLQYHKKKKNNNNNQHTQVQEPDMIPFLQDLPAEWSSKGPSFSWKIVEHHL